MNLCIIWKKYFLFGRGKAIVPELTQGKRALYTGAVDAARFIFLKEYTSDERAQKKGEGTMKKLLALLLTLALLAGLVTVAAAEADMTPASSTYGWVVTPGSKDDANYVTVEILEAKTSERKVYTSAYPLDSISSLTVQLTGSSFTGSVNTVGQAGTVDLAMDGNSSWTLTGDSYLTSFSGDLQRIDANGFHLFVDGEEVL